MNVLLKYGFDDIIDRLRIDIMIHESRRIFLRQKGREFRQKSRPERIRLALEELGPTFIKLGQMLSTRVDLLPKDYISELKKLQDEVAPLPIEQVRSIIEEELGAPLESHFEHFEGIHEAAASLAQVHRATLKGQQDVVVKVQRPNIHIMIRGDIDILTDLANLTIRHIPESSVYDPVGLINEFKRWIFQELDFYQEGRNINKFQRNFKTDNTVYVPDVYWDLTTSRVLTMEYIDGIGILDLAKIDKAGLNRKTIAQNGAEAVLKQIFEHGFFHGDPHPGNILVLENNVIAPLDFGLMGRLDQETIEQLGNVLKGIIERNTDRVIRVLLSLDSIQEGINLKSLRTDLSEFIDRYYQVPLYQFNIEQIVNEIQNLTVKHQIRFPKNLFLMGKAMMVMEGVGKTLDPDFDMVGLAKPYIQKFMINQLNPKRMVKDLIKLFEDYTDLINALPENLKRIIIKIRQGELGINLHHQGLDRLIREMDKSTNRLSFSMIIAALIIASSLIIQLDKGPMIFGLSAFGLLGYLIAAFLGLWLVMAILKSGRL